jgi:hypothetical protein
VQAEGAPERELLAESADKLFYRGDGTPVEVLTQGESMALRIGGGMRAVKVR